MTGAVHIPGVKALLAESKTALSGSGGLRMRLMTACAAVLVLTLAPILLLDCLLYAAGLLGGMTAEILSVTVDVLTVLLLVLVGLPMAAAVYRMAVTDALLPAPAGSGAEDEVPAYASGWETVGDALRGCLYPFSSLHAYGLCLRAALGWLLWVAEIALLPGVCILAFRYDWWTFLPLIPAALTAVRVCAIVLSAAAAIALFLFSGSPAAYAFRLFAPDTAARVGLSRILWGQRGTHRTLMLLRLRMTMWVILSAAAVIVPLFLITLPVCLSVSARFSRALTAGADAAA